MSTFGSDPGSWSGWQSWYSTRGQVGQDFTVPSNGSLKVLHGYVAGDGAAKDVTLAVWRGDTVIASVTGPTGVGSGSAGGQSWVSGTVSGYVPIFSGETLRLGWWRSQTAGFYDWSEAAGGSYYTVDNGSIGGWAGLTSFPGSIGAYVDYQIGSRVRFNGGSFGRVRINGVEARVRVNGVFI